MNNNYDPNQQYQAPQQPQYQQYQAPQQSQYQQYHAPQQPQYQQTDYQYQQQGYQYQQPLYQQPPLKTSFFILAIIGLALSCTFYLSIAGIIVSAIALSKTKKHFAMGGLFEGKAKVAKILSTIGLWGGVGMSVFFVIWVIYMIIIVAAAASYDPYSYYYY